MQIRKTYEGVNPELLYAEIKDFVLRDRVTLGEAKMETYTLPDNTSSFISRGTLTFKTAEGAGKTGNACLRVNIVGSVRTQTKLVLDIDEKLFPQEKISALQEDLGFIFGSYEVKPDGSGS